MTAQETYWKLEVFGNDPDEIGFFGTSGIQVPSGTTAERPSSPTAGHFRYNTDTLNLESYIGGAWNDVITGVGGTIGGVLSLAGVPATVITPVAKAALGPLGVGASIHPPGSIAIVTDDATGPTPFILTYVDGSSTWIRSDTLAAIS